MECQPAGFGCQACWEHLQTDGERRKDTFNKHTNERRVTIHAEDKQSTNRKRRHRMKKPSSQKWFFSHRVVIDVVDKQELMFDIQRDRELRFYIF